MKKFFLTLFFSIFSVFLFADPIEYNAEHNFPPSKDFPPPPVHHKPGKYKNFHGKRFVSENESKDFKAVIIRTFDFIDIVLMEILFNGPVDSESINSECIKVNHIPVDFNQLRFSKNRSTFRFILSKDFLSKDTDCFLFEMENIKSVNGNRMQDVELKNCTLASEYRFSEKEQLWKRF